MIWVQMHHPDHRQCYFISPLIFKIHVDLWHEGIRCDFDLGLMLPRIYFPWQVSNDYRAAMRALSGEEDPYDEIPF
jgi:hypothetical protein